MNLNLNPEQKEELKKLVEEDAYNILDDIERSKEDLKIIIRAASKAIGISTAMIKKLAEVNFKDSLAEETIKFNAINSLWFEVFGGSDEFDKDDKREE